MSGQDIRCIARRVLAAVGNKLAGEWLDRFTRIAKTGKSDFGGSDGSTHGLGEPAAEPAAAPPEPAQPSDGFFVRLMAEHGAATRKADHSGKHSMKR